MPTSAYAGNIDASTQADPLYQLNRAWTETGSTWNAFASGSAWQTAGADRANDRDAVSLGAVTGTAVGSLTVSLNASGIALVQGWVNGSVANQGFIMLNAGNTDGLDVSSSEASTTSLRPKLTVTYQ